MIQGIRRCGEFASSSVNHTRQEAGAGYYGVMELSGSISEPVVSLGNVAGRSFQAINGNGELNTAGYADVDYWPGINGNNNPAQASLVYGGSTGVTQNAGTGYRGGNMAMFYYGLYVSLRTHSCNGFPLTRDYPHGARLVRNAF
jgi:hypothetical protein